MKFYKRKIFYIPLLLFLLLVTIASALLYKPVKLIYWVAVEYPKEVKILEKYDTLIANPSTFFTNYTTFQPKLEDFQDLNKQLQTIKRDFIIMDKIGLGEVYIYAASSLATKFVILSKIKREFFSYPETKALNQPQMQQYQEILKNTQEIKEAISKEQFQFAQAYEDFYQSVKHTTNPMHIYFINIDRFSINSLVVASNSYSDHICQIPNEHIEILVPRVKESYEILKNLTPNADVLKYINQTSYEEFIAKITGLIQYLLSHCKRND